MAHFAPSNQIKKDYLENTIFAHSSRQGERAGPIHPFLFLGDYSSEKKRKTTDITPVVVHTPKIVNAEPIKVTGPVISTKAKAKHFPKTNAIVHTHSNFPPPLPLPPLKLQNLIDQRVRQTTKETSHRATFTPAHQEMINYTNDTTEPSPIVFGSEFMKRANIPDFEKEMESAPSREMNNDDDLPICDF